MLEGLIEYLVKNRQDAGLVGYLFVLMIFSAIAFYKEWIVLGKPYKRECEDNAEKTKDLETIGERLTDQRIINERAAAVIDSLREKNRELEMRLARAEGADQPRRQRPRQ